LGGDLEGEEVADFGNKFPTIYRIITLLDLGGKKLVFDDQLIMKTQAISRTR
jgi:hypothetical protein